MKYVHWMIVRLDENECLATHYWTGKGWTKSYRGSHARRPLIMNSLKEARAEATKVPYPAPPRTHIWASGSKAKQTMFKVNQQSNYNLMKELGIYC